jgi:hypothetical protein
MASQNMNVDYDIHGLLGVRLINPAVSLAQAAARQMNPLQPTILTSPPDVIISRLRDADREQRYRTGDAGDSLESGFDESGFALISRGSRLSIPFDQVGASCSMACSENFGMRKLLINFMRPALQISLLPKEALALHSAAVSYKGRGILLAGWAESGKTEAMLGFLAAGAYFVSDKWTIVDGDGSSIHHFPTPITVRDWMIDLIPGLRQRVTRAERLRARAAGVASALLGTRSAVGRLPLVSEVKGLADLAGRVSVTPSQLMGTGDESSRWEQLKSAPLSALFLLMTTNDRKISVRPSAAAEIAPRLADCAMYERRAFFGVYERFRYALPERRNALIEGAREMETSLLKSALASKSVFVVEVPFPFDPLALREAMAPYC